MLPGLDALPLRREWLKLFGRAMSNGGAAQARGMLQLSAPAARNIIRNGSFKRNTRVTMPTTDNGFGPDGWRLLLEAANAATWARDTSDVPTGAQYALALTVGAGNNNKFGICQMIPSVDCVEHRGMSLSIVVPMKATVGLTNGAGRIRIGIAQFAGTADSVSGDPISSWGAEGTNPTLAANWAFINTPAAISVSTGWAEYVVENVTPGATMNNLMAIIWCDEKSTTAATDVLRIGGAVTMARGAKAPMSQVADNTEEEARCSPHVDKSYDQSVAPGTASNTAGSVFFNAGTTSVGQPATYRSRKHSAGTVTLYSVGTGASGQLRDVTGTSDSAATVFNNGESGFYMGKNTAGVAGNQYAFHWFYTDGVFG